MNTKLTLSIQEEVIKKAKDYARQNERSLSDLVENYLKALVVSEPEISYGKSAHARHADTPISNALLGVVPELNDADLEDIRYASIKRKYLK
jgi:hypothetical protein